MNTKETIDDYIEVLSKIKGDVRTQDEVIIKRLNDLAESIRSKHKMSQHDYDCLCDALTNIALIKARQ